MPNKSNPILSIEVLLRRHLCNNDLSTTLNCRMQLDIDHQIVVGWDIII